MLFGAWTSEMIPYDLKDQTYSYNHILQSSTSHRELRLKVQLKVNKNMASVTDYAIPARYIEGSFNAKQVEYIEKQGREAKRKAVEKDAQRRLVCLSHLTRSSMEMGQQQWQADGMFQPGNRPMQGNHHC